MAAPRLLELGSTSPIGRLIAMPIAYPAPWPQSGRVEPNHGADLVFDFLTKYNGDPARLIPPAEDWPEAEQLEWIYSVTGGQYLPGIAWSRAAYYLTLALQGPLPEDEERNDNAGPARDWPNPSSTLERRVYGWSLRTTRWGDNPWSSYRNSIPRVVARKMMQLQKFDPTYKNGDGSVGKWFIFNQWGTDLTFGWDGQNWVAGFDTQDWLDQHGRDLYTAVMLGMSIITTVVSFGTLTAAESSLFIGTITAVQAAAKSLAEACAKGDLGSILVALQSAASALGRVPGGADFANRLASAASESGAGTINLIMSNPTVRAGFQAMNSAIDSGKGVVDAALALKTKLLSLVGTSGQDLSSQVASIRTSMIPPQLVPWFDRAVQQGTLAVNNYFAPNHPVPPYAQGVWNFGATYGVLGGNGPAHAAKKHLTELDLIRRAQQAATQQVVATSANQAAGDLLTYIRQLEKKYGLTDLERQARRADLKAAGYTDAQLKAMGYG